MSQLLARNTKVAQHNNTNRDSSCSNTNMYSPLPGLRPPGPGGDSLEAVKETMEGVQGVTATSKPREIAATFEREMNKHQRLINQATDAINALDQSRQQYRFIHHHFLLQV